MPASRKSPVLLFVLSLAAMLIGLGPTLAKADLILMSLDSTAPVSGTGSFDVALANIGGTTVINVSAFSVELSLPDSSGVSFTGVNTNTAASNPYIFGTLQSPPLTFNSFPTTNFIVSDSSATPPFFVSLNPGDLYGLEHVTYAVAPGASPGPVTVSILGIGSTTQILDVTGNLISFTPTNGTITVVATAVPEPSSFFLSTTALIIGASLAFFARRRKTTRGIAG